MNQILLPASAPPDETLLILGCIFAGLLGLAFGSFLNVCLSRLPEGENIALPRSHCRSCAHTLSWWENLPLLSWILLRGRCRSCRAPIGIRYPLVELAVGLLWAAIWLRLSGPLFGGEFGRAFLGCWGEIEPTRHGFAYCLVSILGYALFSWILIALAALDAEYLWLPDWITLPGIGLGFTFTIVRAACTASSINFRPGPPTAALANLFAILAAAGLILFIRLAYWLVRRREGIGLGDAKLMAMLGAWLGLRGALESFALAILGTAIAAIVWMAIQLIRGNKRDWSAMPLPLGTFLCLGAITEIFANGWFWNCWTRTFSLSQ